jgi:hypothetical protein
MCSRHVTLREVRSASHAILIKDLYSYCYLRVTFCFPRDSAVFIDFGIHLLLLQYKGYDLVGGPGSVVRIATGNGLDDPGDRIPVGGEIFRTCPDRPWGPPNLLYNRYRVFPRGKEQPGRDADPSPPSSAVGHERVELYLYSPYGPYGLYRASVPVQGCTLTYLMMKSSLCTPLRLMGGEYT